MHYKSNISKSEISKNSAENSYINLTKTDTHLNLTESSGVNEGGANPKKNGKKNLSEFEKIKKSQEITKTDNSSEFINFTKVKIITGEILENIVGNTIGNPINSNYIAAYKKLSKNNFKKVGYTIKFRNLSNEI